MAKANKKFTDGELWKFIKFAFAASISFVAQYLSYMFLHSVVFISLDSRSIDVSNPVWSKVLEILGASNALGAFIATMISVIIGYAVAYIMNRKITFQSSGHLARSITIYIIMVLVTMIVSSVIASQLTSWAAGKGLVGEGSKYDFISNTVINILSQLLPTVYTYPLQRFVINPPKKKAAGEAEAAEEPAAEEE